jgi:c-di-GMP-binding flagellar brake protein YcgR
LGTQKSRVFAVRKPRGVESLQRRAHVRVDLERTIRLRSLADGPESKGIGKTVNIGVAGVKFATSMPLVFGEQLRLALILTPHDIVGAGGPVVRIEEPADPASEADPVAVAVAGTTPLRTVAVRFDSISEVDRERIACHILAAHRRRPAEPRPTVAAPVAKVPAPPA